MNRLYEINKYYHIYNRGCNKEEIFHDRKDYEKLMHCIYNSKINEYLELYAFSLMSNHYHFFVKQISDKPIYKWLQYIFNQYSQYFNNRHGRIGTIFEGSAKYKEINNIEYLGLIAHYVHSNPKDKLQMEFSSLIRLKDKSLINQDFYIQNFGSVKEYLLLFEEFLQNKKSINIDDFIFDK